MTDTARLSTPWPRAWNTEEQTTLNPANRKLMEMIRRAGTPMVSMSLPESSAMNIFRNTSGISWKASSPSSMMPTAYITLSLMVFTMRSGFRAP